MSIQGYLLTSTNIGNSAQCYMTNYGGYLFVVLGYPLTTGKVYKINLTNPTTWITLTITDLIGKNMI